MPTGLLLPPPPPAPPLDALPVLPLLCIGPALPAAPAALIGAMPPFGTGLCPAAPPLGAATELPEPPAPPTAYGSGQSLGRVRPSLKALCGGAPASTAPGNS